jgi:large subunit ribosomal protein L35
MPKMKTHKGTVKRVRTTKNGVLLRARAFGNHLLSGKSESRKRTIATGARITGKNARNVKRALGLA